MTGRTTRRSVTFSRPFSLSDLDGIQPAGTYRIQTLDVTLDSLSFLAYRRVSTTIELPCVGVAGSRRHVIAIDPLELETALNRDSTENAEDIQTMPNISMAGDKNECGQQRQCDALAAGHLMHGDSTEMPRISKRRPTLR